MKRTLITTLVAALVLAAPAGAASKRFAAAELTACETSLDQADRSLAAEGRMGVVPGTVKLRLRFDLQVRTRDRPRWTDVEGDKLGVWMTVSPAPRRKYVYAKRIENLAAPADYRMVVRFRWVGAGGRKLGGARRVSDVCEQPDLRADLVADPVSVMRTGDPAWARYVVPVRNTGQSAADPFAVTLAVGGRVLRAEVPDGLGAGENTRLEIAGPRCEPGSPLQLVVDADGTVDEADEADNQLVRACPA